MAYACPVCDALAPDGEHLAHHLAIVAMARGSEHETWLDDHATGWRDATPDALAAAATEHAEAVEHELVDDVPGERPDVGHAEHGHHQDPLATNARGRPGGAAGAGGAGAAGDEETAAAFAEAREITERMLADEGGGGDDGTGDGAAADSTADDVTENDDSTETDTDE